MSIQDIQTALSKLIPYTGTIDGRAGPITDASMAAFISSWTTITTALGTDESLGAAWQQVVSASNSPVTAPAGAGQTGLIPSKSGELESPRLLTGDGTWPYAWKVDGDDLISCAMDGTPMEVVITSFGGWGGGNISDPQDNGSCASGKNTKQQALSGVSLAMDPDDYPEMKANDPQGYAALKGAPLPRIPWGTLVTVTVGCDDYTPADGIIDLGPGKHASKPGQPHGCDLSPIAAHLVDGTPVNRAANDFEVRGTVRIIGAAKFAS